MSERNPTVTLVAFDPDGGEHKIRTAAQYDWAGLAKGSLSQWTLVSKGWSHDSVRSRAITRGEWGARIEVVKFSETTSAYAATQRDKIRARAGCCDDCSDKRGPEKQLALVRELASNYHNNLLSAESAMDAIAAAVL